MSAIRAKMDAAGKGRVRVADRVCGTWVWKARWGGR